MYVGIFTYDFGAWEVRGTFSYEAYCNYAHHQNATTHTYMTPENSVTPGCGCSEIYRERLAYFLNASTVLSAAAGAKGWSWPGWGALIDVGLPTQ